MAEYKGELFDEMPTGAGRGRINPVAPMEKLTPETLASPEGKALIARQNEQMAATPEPNAVAATREIAPVAANIVKDNAVEGFNTLTPGEAKVAGGLGAAGLEYAIYRSLRDKIDKNPPTSVTPASPSNKPFIDPTFTDTFGSDQPVNKLDALRKLHNIEAPQTIETAPVFTPEEHRLQRQQIAINQARQELSGTTPVIQNSGSNVVPTVETSPNVASNAPETVTPPTTAAPETIPAETNAPAPPSEITNAPVIPTEEQKTAAEKAAKEKVPLFSEADKKAFTSEQRSVLQHMQYGKNPEEAKALLRHFESTLPEGVKLSYGTYPEDVYNEAGKKVKTAGTSKGGFPEPKQNLLNFWNEALGTNHAINEKGNFDYKPTAEDVSKAHSYWSDKLKTASSPSEIANAQKGFASVGALARLAGVSLGALGAMSAYKEGKETGDWSSLGLLGGSLLAGASAPAQVAYQAATYSKPLGETPEQLKEFGKRLEYANKVGYGRGTQGSTGGGQGFRGIAPPPR